MREKLRKCVLSLGNLGSTALNILKLVFRHYRLPISGLTGCTPSGASVNRLRVIELLAIVRSRKSAQCILSSKHFNGVLPKICIQQI